MARNLTFRHFLTMGVLKEKDLGKVYLLGMMLPRFEGRPAGSFEQDEAIKKEILSLRPEELFAELETEVQTNPEKFGGPGPERVMKMIAEARVLVPQDEFREGERR